MAGASAAHRGTAARVSPALGLAVNKRRWFGRRRGGEGVVGGLRRTHFGGGNVFCLTGDRSHVETCLVEAPHVVVSVIMRRDGRRHEGEAR